MGLEKSCSKEDFIENMSKLGYRVNWKDTRKNIVFINENGKRIRDSRLSKTFNVDIQGGILYELEKNKGKQQKYSGSKQQDGTEITSEYTRKLYEYEQELHEYERELDSYYTRCEECEEGRNNNRTTENINRTLDEGIERFEAEKRNKMQRTRRTKKDARKINIRNFFF